MNVESYNGGLAMFFKEDVQKMMNCSAYTALNMMRATGKSIMVGKRMAVPVIAFLKYMHGEDYTGIEIGKPVDGLHVG